MKNKKERCLDRVQYLLNQIDLLEKNKIILEDQAVETNKILAEMILLKYQVEAINKSQLNFIATMSHELRTPLNAILGFAQVMNDEIFGPINNKNYKEYISFILSSGKHLLSLINDILDVSKMETNKVHLYETNVDLKKILKEIVGIIKKIPHAEERIFHIHDFENIILKVDERLLKQVFFNALSNAVKFTKKGGFIDIYIKKTNFGIRIIFKDNGIGIPKNKISTLFQPFVQIENNMTRTLPGTGLGLVLVKKIVILHQGRVELKSAFSKGSSLIIDLPRERIVSWET